ncbi:MAG: NAD(+) diphosphatase [Betaproteobacteria bacterium]|nr:NAD(+) diphosphatase [Betaproteobacteria bacterium]
MLPSAFRPLVDISADPGQGGLWFIFQTGCLLVRCEGDTPCVPRLAAGSALPVPVGTPTLIGVLGITPCWAVEADAAAMVPVGWQFEGLRRLFNRLSDEIVAIAGRALQWLEFERTHRFCGVCATPMENHEGGHSRRCPKCEHTVYPCIAPAMMVLIKRDTTRGRELLLARNVRAPGPFYSALAGFVEPSESIEGCVHREVCEEVGLTVRNLRYFGSQSWPFPHSLMVAYVADYEQGEIVCQASEIVDAQWFTLQSLPQLPHRLSIARRLINSQIAEIDPTHAALRV